MDPTTGSVIASITVSLDGYVAGPDAGPGRGLGTGGERLHNWVMGGPWSYGSEPALEMDAADRAFYESLTKGMGAGVVGRRMYDAGEAWGGSNPFPRTLVVLTHRVEDQPEESSGFRFVSGFQEALAAAHELAGEQDVLLGGGADLIRQGLAAGVVDELAISTAPVVLGGGKRLFDGFTRDVELDILDIHPSSYAVHARYAVHR